jgi:uncharacterized protein YfeS
MELHVIAKSYDCYGGHTTLSAIGDFLLRDAPHFGDAVKEITVTFYFHDRGPPKKSLEHLFEIHQSYRATLPKITYRRAKGRIEINVASELVDGRDWQPSPRLSLPLFIRGVDEVTRALSLLQDRLKKHDAFDLTAFLSHCEAAKQRIPIDEDDLQVLAAEQEAEAKERRGALSPWERLKIDWEDFHPRAREILDDPFFWERSNDFAPNGNDTGADLLAGYRAWLERHDDAQPVRFLERLAKQWGYKDIEDMDGEILDEAAIGLAFADIKLRGACDEQARELALQAIERQRTRAQAAVEWPHREERLKTLDVMERKLRH